MDAQKGTASPCPPGFIQNRQAFVRSCICVCVCNPTVYVCVCVNPTVSSLEKHRSSATSSVANENQEVQTGAEGPRAGLVPSQC